MGTDGRIGSQGSVSDALAADQKLTNEIRREKEAIENDIDDTTEADEAVVVEVKSGKLIIAEEVAEGHLGWPSREPCSLIVMLISDVNLF